MFHQSFDTDIEFFSRRCIWVNGPVIVGAGPSGLAVRAGLKEQGVPFIVLERADCIASLWLKRTYDRLKLHLPKQFCQLIPHKNQFISYLESYANHFDMSPNFNEAVQSAKYDETFGLWRVKTIISTSDSNHSATAEVEYICRWLVVATGENSEKVVPEFEGLEEFKGNVVHACDYKSGVAYHGQQVLVVGCGNSGMEVSLDLCNHNASPSMVVRSSVHVLPREIFGKSTFELAVLLMKWLPLWLADKILLMLAWLIFENLEKYGNSGKTPVLDIGALEKIRSVELVDGQNLEIDSVILATGYRSNVPSWLKENEFFSREGIPKNAFPNGWKGNAGLYAVGFTRRGLSGASLDAIGVSQDIAKSWKEETKQKRKSVAARHRRCISHF
ncbi:unnamed protein product [Malus baccata var. baccata]